MERRELEALFQRALDTYHQCMSEAAALTDEQLDARVSWFGDRQIGIRNLLYLMVSHNREHAMHLAKILQATDAPGARPTEAQLILGQVAESLGALHGVLARLSDEDLDREFEGQTPRKVLEHVASTHVNYAGRVRTYLQASTTQAAS